MVFGQVVSRKLFFLFNNVFPAVNFCYYFSCSHLCIRYLTYIKKLRVYDINEIFMNSNRSKTMAFSDMNFLHCSVCGGVSVCAEER